MPGISCFGDWSQTQYLLCILYIIRGPAGCIGDINHGNIKQPDLIGSKTYVDSTGDLNQPCYQHGPLNKATDPK